MSVNAEVEVPDARLERGCIVRIGSAGYLAKLESDPRNVRNLNGTVRVLLKSGVNTPEEAREVSTLNGGRHESVSLTDIEFCAPAPQPQPIELYCEPLISPLRHQANLP